MRVLTYGFLAKTSLERGRNLGLLLTLGIALLLISFFSPRYLSVDNLLVVALQVSFIGIASLGTALLIISGNVDLSIGSQYALCAVTAAMLAKAMPAPLAWIAGIALGATLGLVDALMVLRINISPIIITLGTLTIFRGVAFENYQRIRGSRRPKIIFLAWTGSGFWNSGSRLRARWFGGCCTRPFAQDHSRSTSFCVGWKQASSRSGGN